MEPMIMNVLRRIGAAFIAALALAAPQAGAAGDPVAALGDADRQCLNCHGQAGLEKEFAKGDSVPLHVEAAAFAKSAHAALGCSACHADVDLKKHPGSGKSYPSSRAFAVAATETCRGCHESSVEAHTKGVHGKDPVSNAALPLCTTCHSSHEIVRASVALRESCFGCHGDALEQHAKWLPNTKTHFNVVACAACHAPSAGKRVELRFHDSKTRAELVTEGEPITGGNGGGDKPMDAARLQAIVHAVEEGGAGGNVLLVGRVEPLKPGEGHHIVAKSQAVKDCAACHRKGADPFQNVSLAIVGPDGQRVRYEAQTDVLHAPTSVDSVRGFYAMGGTRMQILDIVLALALIGGISAPLGHFVVRRLMRRKGERHE
ncbi:MAG TPA: hypothetical protein VFP44_20585 [Usitatibacter sp.]|nr:hypothetical protein [Usitatibacter sp.]